MKKQIVVGCFIYLFVLISCRNNEYKIQLAEQYYRVLNTADYNMASKLISDSLLTTEVNYKMAYSKEDYIEFLKWDAVFRPKYKVLNMEEKGGVIEATVSKIDKRILFLHESPIVTKQIIRFENNKISRVDTPVYFDFNDSVFSRNREKLLNWMDANYPEDNNFIYDQTETGGLNYLKAINLYNDAH